MFEHIRAENGTKGKRQPSFVWGKWKTEMANYHLFAANRNKKQKFVFLGRQR
jgi:hypothetical protein